MVVNIQNFIVENEVFYNLNGFIVNPNFAISIIGFGVIVEAFEEIRYSLWVDVIEDTVRYFIDFKLNSILDKNSIEVFSFYDVLFHNSEDFSF